jgi:hypothetical protein
MSRKLELSLERKGGDEGAVECGYVDFNMIIIIFDSACYVWAGREAP